MRNTTFLFALLALLPAGGIATAADWITAPSTFTHDPSTGERVSQFAPIGPVYASNYQRSVYHHTRSTLQVGDSIDVYHQTDEYGKRVRPYDE